jgi:hypothetical protein
MGIATQQKHHAARRGRSRKDRRDAQPDLSALGTARLAKADTKVARTVVLVLDRARSIRNRHSTVCWWTTPPGSPGICPTS